MQEKKNMVKLHIKRGDDSIFLYDTTVEVLIEDLLPELIKFYNGILKVQRLCQGKQLFYILNFSYPYYYTLLEMESLSQYGVMLPPNMIGLTDEQVQELGLIDEYKDVCIPSGGFVINKDPVGRRNGKGSYILCDR